MKTSPILSRIGTAVLFCVSLTVASAATTLEDVDVFTSGKDGYAIYRIPAVVPTTSGTLLAFAEGRKDGAGDAGRIDLVLRRSRDHGRTWEPMQIVWSDGANTCGNPAPVVDVSTGRIWLLSTWNLATDKEKMIGDGVSSDTRRVFRMHSDDDGISWSKADEITSSVKLPDWRWYATGPCHGIQLRDGRLVIPANHSRQDGNRKLTSSHVIFSDDHGSTWHISEEIGGHTNESTVAELPDGRLYINMRNYRGLKQRAFAWSDDHGQTWTHPENDPVLVEPVCQGSVLRCPTDSADQSLFLFSNPASTKREKMTIRVSRDECRSWGSGTLIYKGRSAYSDLCPLPEKQVGLLYEREAGAVASGRITFARVPLQLLLETTSSQGQTSMTLPRIETNSLPPLPDAHGFAGMFAGIHDGAVVAAGGANFPGKKPWEGGTKSWHDTAFCLEKGATTWTQAGRLPRPLGYGVSLTVPDGVLCIGGEDGKQVFADVFLMQWISGKLKFSQLPPLPAPSANACGGQVGTKVYVMGGISRQGATSADSNVYALDIENTAAGWTPVETWPGRPRMLATAAAAGGSLYICGGVDLHAGPDGKPVRTYLTDAYRYDVGKSWTRIADLPRAAVAAASPAAALGSSGFCILGGDDGTRAGTPPASDHPGFPRSALYYDKSADTWSEVPADFAYPVTLPLVPWGNSWILPSGEIRPGVRTPQITAIQFFEE